MHKKGYKSSIEGEKINVACFACNVEKWDFFSDLSNFYLDPSDALKIRHFTISKSKRQAMLVMLHSRKSMKEKTHAPNIVAKYVIDQPAFWFIPADFNHRHVRLITVHLVKVPRCLSVKNLFRLTDWPKNQRCSQCLKISQKCLILPTSYVYFFALQSMIWNLFLCREDNTDQTWKPLIFSK